MSDRMITAVFTAVAIFGATVAVAAAIHAILRRKR